MEISIADVITVNGVQIINMQRGTCVCPFCGDARGKFAFSASKNAYNCFRCGEHGGMFDLHKKLNPLPEFVGADGNKAAAKHLRDLMSGEAYSVKRAEYVKLAFSDKKKEEATRKSDDEISVVYRHLLSLLKLKKGHRDDLRQRGLSEEQINVFSFRSVPEDTKKICSLLQKGGINLEGVPGFYQTKNGTWDMAIPRDEAYAPKSGYFCPAMDEEGRIIGMQIRMDDPGEKGAKYVWFSSSERKLGTPSGAIATFLPGEGKCLLVTEGILKATIIWFLLKKQVTVVGIPGVGNRKSLIPYIENRENAVFACIAFDMDRFSNEKVMKAEAALSDLLHSYNIDTHSLTWDIDSGGIWRGKEKGLDDFLVDNPAIIPKISKYIFEITKENMEMKNIFF